MHKYLLAAAAALAVSSPAAARDPGPYVGIEGGILFASDTDFDLTVQDGTDEADFQDAFKVDYRTGIDADFIAGYDFGPARAELELGYKRAKIDGFTLSEELAEAIEDEGLEEEDFAVEGKASALSLMGNVLFDLDATDRVSLFAGGGLGVARVKLAGERDDAPAWQLIAGVRTAVTDHVDLGLKYRYFNTGKLEFSDSVEDFSLAANGKFRSHSLLASLVYNFGPSRSQPQAIASPPPPAPIAPATQVCADGSVILATDICPAPVIAPPPPPQPLPGERG